MCARVRNKKETSRATYMHQFKFVSFFTLSHIPWGFFNPLQPFLFFYNLHFCKAALAMKERARSALCRSKFITNWNLLIVSGWGHIKTLWSLFYFIPRTYMWNCYIHVECEREFIKLCLRSLYRAIYKIHTSWEFNLYKWCVCVSVCVCWIAQVKCIYARSISNVCK